MHLVHLALEVGELVARQRHQHTEVLAQVANRLVVTHSEHVLDDDLVAQTDPEGEPVS